MASSYSDNLKIELIGTGDQAGSWGATTNGNLGTVLEEAIVGRGTVNFSSDADTSITISNGPAASAARCIYLYLTSTTLTATRTLTVEAVKKTYIIQNATSGNQSIIVTTGSGTTVTIPNGKRMIVYVDPSSVPLGGGVAQQFSEIDATTTIGGEAFATVDGVQTLTNKTLTAPDINGGTVAQTVLTTPALIEFGGAVYKTGSLSSDITTNTSNKNIVVDILANGASVGDYLVLADATSVGGVPAEELNRVNVITAVTTNTVTFESTTQATDAVTGGGNPYYSLLPKITPPSSPTTLIGSSETVTLTNKRITPRVTTNGSTYSGNLTPISYSTDQYTVTGLNGPTTFLAPSAAGGDAPTQGQKLVIRIKDAGARRTATVPTNGISVTLGSTSVTITDNSNGASAGDYVTISGVASAIGGISAGTLNSRFIIDSVTTNTITITVPTAATATATGGTGATLSYDGLKLTWTTTSGGYRVIGTSLPTATTAGKTIYVGCIYNATDTYWDVVAVTTQA